MHTSTLSFDTSIPATTGSFCAIVHSLPCSFGLKALATVRVEEDTGAVPRSVTGFLAFGRNGLSSSNGRFSSTARSHILTDFPDTRAQGMPGARPHPQSSWAKREDAHKSSGRAEIARHSLRNGVTAAPRSPWGTGLSSPHREQISAFRPQGRNRISARLIP